MTVLNQQILNMIRKSDGHMTAEEAFLLAKKQKINVSVASIYRILGKLAQDGYIKRFSVAGGADVFDKTLSDHAHLVCSKCGKVTDIYISDLKKSLSKQMGVVIDDYELSINYICNECKKGKGERK